jgi:hypothetical protein
VIKQRVKHRRNGCIPPYNTTNSTVTNAHRYTATATARVRGSYGIRIFDKESMVLKSFILFTMVY